MHKYRLQGMLLCSTARIGLPRWRLRCIPQRSLFSLPDISSVSPFGPQPDIQKYHERKILPYSQKELFDVVSDVASYSRFVPFCTGSRIIKPLIPEPGSLGKSTMDAELTVGFLSFKESYVSKVTCLPCESVEAIASSSTPLFKTLKTIWTFQPVSPQSPHPPTQPLHLPVEVDALGPTLVTLDLVYAFASPFHAGVSAAFFSQVSKLMIQAFEQRCLSIYGPGSR